MTSQQIAEVLARKFGPKIKQSLPADKHPRIHVDAVDWRSIAEYLRHDPALHLDWLQNLSGVDYVADDRMCVVYDFWSFDHRHQFAVKVYAPRENAHIASVADLWRTADWHEREAYDMFGIIFDGHTTGWDFHCGRTMFFLANTTEFPAVSNSIGSSRRITQSDFLGSSCRIGPTRFFRIFAAKNLSKP
jgi:NADH-quinone oxidoreductase subunit C